MLGLTGSEALLAMLVIGLGALVQATVGFGLALLAAPVLLAIDPRLVPAPIVLAALPLSLAIGWRERSAVDLGGLGRPILGQLVGTLLALAVLSFASESLLGLLIGCVVLCAVVLSIGGLQIRPTRRNLVVAGLSAGFMGTTASIPGPPIALVYQHLPPARLRVAMVPFFLVGAVFTLTGLHLAGRCGRVELELALLLLPGVAVGFMASHLAMARVDRVLLRRCVLALSALAASALILRSASRILG